MCQSCWLRKNRVGTAADLCVTCLPKKGVRRPTPTRRVSAALASTHEGHTSIKKRGETPFPFYYFFFYFRDRKSFSFSFSTPLFHEFFFFSRTLRDSLALAPSLASPIHLLSAKWVCEVEVLSLVGRPPLSPLFP